MEDGSGQSGVRAPAAEDVYEMLWRTGATRRDHRNRNCVGDNLYQLTIKASLSPVAVHGGEQDFTSSAIGRFARPLQRVAACGNTPSGNKHLEIAVHPPGIDGHHYRLRAKTGGNFSD